MAFFELGPGPRPLFEPGTWDVGYLEGGLVSAALLCPRVHSLVAPELELIGLARTAAP